CVTHLPRVLTALPLNAPPPRGDALAAPERDVRRLDRAFLLQDAAARVALRRLGVALDHVDALDDDASVASLEAQHAAALALVLAGDDDDLITFANVHDL